MIQNYALTVTDIPILIATGESGDADRFVLISNTGNQDCFVGGEAVTSANGVFIHKGDSIASRESFKLTATDKLYAICGAGHTTTVRVLTGGN